jgi:hypothetical protein
MPRQESSVFLSRAARAWLGLLGFVAAVAQLVTAPWPLWARVSICAVLLLVGLLLLVYHTGVRRGERAGADEGIDLLPSMPGQLSSGWTSQQLSGRYFVKVASKGSSVTVCALHDDGSINERHLPLSANDAHEFSDSWSGSWIFLDDLSLFVAGHHLIMRPSLKGTWTGVEYFGYEEHRFVGAVIDPEPISAGQAWVALRLVSGREKRWLLSADADGTLRETDLYERSPEREGKWETDGRGIRLDIDGEVSVAEPSFQNGLLIATDKDRRESREFALVRVLVHS